MSSSASVSNNSIIGMIAGVYTLGVEDSNGCSTTIEVEITEPDILTSDISGVDALCFGGNEGSVTIVPQGGTSPYSVLWSNGSTDLTVMGLTAGTYFVTVSDNNGCETTNSIEIEEPATAVSVTLNSINPDCEGVETGEVTATPAGGTPGYTYLWNNGETTATISDLTAGTYTVTVSDINGCTAIASVILADPTGIVATITATMHNECFGDELGSATVTGTGGSGDYSYLWSDAQITATAAGLPAGTYTVTVTDVNGDCSAVAFVEITQPTLLVAEIINYNDAGCNGEATGSATVNGTGGTTPYTYEWSDGQTTTMAVGLVAGSYDVTIMDANDCEAVTTVIISESDAVTAVASTVEDVNCFGAGTGIVTVIPGGGIEPYAYLWSNGSTDETVTGLIAGLYDVTVYDANGCFATSSTVVTEPLLALTAEIDPLNVINPDCEGETTGSAEVSVFGGTGPYTYLWSDGQTSELAENLTAGTYLVTVTDDNGCTVVASVLLVDPTGVTATISTSTNNECFGDETGSATVIASGGSGTYSYIWSDGQMNPIANNLGAGGYLVVVTDDQGCSAIASVTITEPTLLISEIINFSNETCFEAENGTATVNATGGTTPYSYLWPASANDQTTSTAMNLASGTYEVTVTDFNGCESTSEVTITGPAGGLNVVLTDSEDASCNGGNDGSIDITVTGGTTPYSFAWSSGDNVEDPTTLEAGVYEVTITDVNGCIVVGGSYVIGEPAAVTAEITSSSNPDCEGNTDGSATVTAGGGTGMYSYAWSNGETTATAVNLTAGTHFVTVTDENGCTAEASVLLTDPTGIEATITLSTNVSCFGDDDGQATVAGSGGVGPYTYLWNTFPVQQTTATALGLGAGQYTVTVTDSQGCSAVAIVNITEPTDLIAEIISFENISCNGGNDGSATVNVTGGITPYTYLWSPSTGNQITSTATGLSWGTHQVTITDGNGCIVSTSVNLTQPLVLNSSAGVINNVNCFGGNNGAATAGATGGTAPYTYLWSNGSTDQIVTGLTAGNYTVTVMDNNNCTSVSPVTITQPGTPVEVDVLSFINPDCEGTTSGSITVGAVGGVGGYSYTWNNGLTGAAISNLTAGTYSVTATDANGCSAETSQILVDPTGIEATITSTTNNICFGDELGSATVTGTGGSGMYEYLWSNGQTSATATGLAAGSYTVTVFDELGDCSAVAFVQITEPTLLIAEIISFTNTSCDGAATGTATVSASGGTTGYSYLWPPSANNQTTATAIELAAGTYEVTVTDENDCDAFATVIISSSGELEIVDIEDIGPLCLETIVPNILLSTTPANSNVIYTWTGGAAAGLIDGNSTGLNAFIPSFEASDMFGTTSVTVEATLDGCSSITTFDIIIEDTESPVFVNCPTEDFEIGIDSDCESAIIWSIPIAEDNCGVVNVVETSVGGPFYGQILIPGVYNIQYTATDAAGNTALCEFTITIVDDSSPLLVCPPSFSIEANEGACDWTSTTGSLDPLLNIDNCPGVELTHTINGGVSVAGTVPVGTVFALGVNTIEYTLSDGVNTPVVCSFNVTVIDGEAPEIESFMCNVTLTATVDAGECTFTQEFEYNPGGMFPFMTDNCTAFGDLEIETRIENVDGSISIYTTTNFSHEFQVGLSTVQLTVTDEAGNTTTCSSNYIVEDNESPAITCPSDVENFERETSAGVCGYIVSGTEFDATATDNCGVVSLTHNYGAWGNGNSLAGATFPVGTTEVIWTAVDASGNTESCTIEIVVEDTEAPIFVNCPTEDFVIGIDSDCQSAIIWSIPIADDNCGVVSVMETSVGGPFYGQILIPGVYDIQYTATDAAGNTAICEFTITIVDDSSPLLVCPPSFTVEANDGACDWTSTTGSLDPLLNIDNCPGVELTHTINGGLPVVGTVPVGTVFALGVNTIEYTLSDGVNPPVVCSFNVTVIDGEAPEIESFMCNVTLTATVDAGECTFNQEFEYNPGGMFPFMTDNCTTFGDLEIETRIENVDGSISIYTTTNFSHEFQVGLSTVQLTVTDEAGNTTTCSSNYIVEDNELPTVTCPANQIYSIVDNTQCGVVGDLILPHPQDNCGIGQFVYSVVLPNGSIDGAFDLTYVYSDPGLFGDETILGYFFPVGVSTVIILGEDNAGNQVICSYTVTVVDDIAPVFVNCPTEDFEIGIDSDCESAIIWSIPIAEDNCGVVNVVETSVGGPFYGQILIPGVYNIQYTATDAAGNTALCEFTITIVDDSSPLLVCPPSFSIEANEGACDWTSTTGSLDPLLNIDNCPGVELTHTINGGVSVAGTVPVGTVFALGVNTIEYTLSDGVNPPVVCSFTVTVIDGEAPAINATLCNATFEYEVNAGECVSTQQANYLFGGVFELLTDNCTAFGDLEIETRIQNPDGTITIYGGSVYEHDYQIGISVLTVTVTDEAGNSSSCSSTVIVTDNELPTVTCPANQEYSIVDNTQCGVVGDLILPHPQDNCGIGQFVYSVVLPDGSIDGAFDLTYVYNDPGLFGDETILGYFFPVGVSIVNILGEDNAGNQVICSYTVTVVDDIAPVFVNCPVDITFTVGLFDDDCEGGAIWSIPIADDNCEVIEVRQVSGPLPGSLLGVGLYDIAYVAEDASGNVSDTCWFAIDVIDTEDPVIVCPGNVVVNETDAGVCEWTSPAGSLSPLLANSNCPATVTWEVENPDGSMDDGMDDVSGYTFDIGTSTVTYTITDDASGQEWTCSFTVTVIDAEAPEILGCSDLGLSLLGTLTLSTEPGLCTVTPTLTPILVIDNCSNTLEADLIVTWPNGLISVETVTQVVIFGFPTPIFFTSPELQVGVNTLELVVRDEAGNESRCITQVIVEDNEIPVITCPTDVDNFERETTAGVCGYVVAGTEFDATATDNCGVESLTHNYGAWGNPSSLAGATFPVGTTEVIWTAVDASGNTVSCTIEIVVEDTEAPVFVNCPVDITFTVGLFDDDCEGGAIWSIPIADDNCEVIEVRQVSGPLPGSLLGVGLYDIAYVAEDASGNVSDTCWFAINVIDTEDPVIVCPGNVVINSTDEGTCEWESPIGSLSPLLANSNCPATVTWEVENPDGSMADGMNDVSGYTFDIGTSTVTYTITDDASGQEWTCSFTVTVVDGESPQINAALCDQTFEYEVNVGECVSTQQGNYLLFGSFELLTDNCTAFADLEIETRIENPDGTITVYNGASFEHDYQLGISVLIVTVTDEAGNSSTCSSTVIVTDEELPIIECPTDVDNFERETTAGVCGYIVSGTEFDATATDNCGVESLTHNYGAWGNPSSLAGATFPVGTTEVIWTAVDASGNTVSCTIEIVVEDTEAPVFVNCPVDITFTVGLFDDDCEGGAIWSIPIADDNCEVIEVRQVFGPAPGSLLGVGLYDIAYVAEDASGNVSDTCWFAINVIDTEDPVIVCPGNVVVNETDAGVCEWTSPAGSLSPLLANSNCPATVTWEVENPDGSMDDGMDDVSGYTFDIGTSTVTYTITDDASGQEWTCSFTVTVIDAEAPEILGCSDLGLSLLGTLTLSTEPGLCTVTPTLTPILVIDNCSNTLEADLIVTWPNGLISVETVTQVVIFGFPTPIFFTSPELQVGVNTLELVVRDEAGNESRCITQVIVEDNEIPVITCPTDVDNFERETTAGVCGYVVAGTEFDATATDNCGVESLTHNYGAWGNPSSLAGATFPVGTTEVIWTAVDASGNTVSCTIEIVVEDTEAPVFVNCPVDITFTVGLFDDDCEGGAIWSIPIADDNCEVIEVRQVFGPAPGSLLGVGLYDIAYVAEDASGNVSDTCWFAINVIDTEDPVIVCPGNVVINSTDEGTCEWESPIGSLSPLLANSNCPATVTWEVENPDGSMDDGMDDVSGYTFDIGTSTVTYTITDDASGQEWTCSFTVTVIDAEAPEILGCSDLGLSLLGTLTLSTEPGLCTVTPTLTPILVIDNCSNTLEADLIVTWPNGLISVETVTQVVIFGFPTPIFFTSPELQVGVNTLELVVRDEAGNESRCITQVIVEDNEIPVITCPTDVDNFERETTAGVCGYVVAGTEFDATATDNCGVESLTHNYGAWGNPSSLAGATFPVGTTEVIWTAVDASGNTVSCTIEIVVEDTEAPVFVNCPVDITFTVGLFDDDCEGGAIWSIPIADDNCEVIEVRQVSGPLPGSLLGVGLYDIAYVAEDASGNVSDTCWFAIDVIDTEDPVIVCPGNVVVNETDAGVCEWTSPAGSLSPLLANSNCPATVTWEVENPDGSMDDGMDDVSGYTFDIGTSTVTYTITDDASGQEWTCSFTVTVIDAEAPEILGCSDLGLSLLGTLTLSTEPGLCTVTPTLTPILVIDNCSNTLEADLIVTWPNGLISVETVTQVVIFGFPTPIFFTSPELQVGVNTLELVVRDEAGNESRCITQVIVEDNEIPVITCPTDVDNFERETTAGVCGYVVAGTEFDATATDNCGVESLTHNYGAWGNPSSLAGATFPVGTTEVIWTAVDASGNTVSCTIEIVVEDTEAPVFVNCPVDITFTVGLFDDDCEGGAIWSIPIADDNCEVLEVRQVFGPAQDSILGVGLYDIAYVAEDASGNVSDTCWFAINVIDTEDPVIVCPGNVIINSTDEGTCEWQSPMGSLSPLLANSNCPATITWEVENPDGSMADGLNDVSGYVFELGTSTVTYTITEDASGQIWTCSFTVTVNDTEAPELICPSDLVLECGDINNIDLINDWIASAVATDNCDDDVEIVASIFSINSQCGNSETRLYRFIATDDFGNSTECFANVIIVDTTPPEIMTPAQPFMVQCDGSSNAADILNWLNNNGFAIAEDLCGTVTWSNDYGTILQDCGTTGEVEVTFTATDQCGNSSSTTAIFSIFDETAPVWEILPQNLTIECDGSLDPYDQIIAWLNTVGGADASDDCSLIVYSDDFAGLEDGCSDGTGFADVTFTASDACGNFVTAIARVSVVDNVAPTIITQARDTLVECDGNGNIADLENWLNDNGGARATDACSEPITWSNELISEILNCGGTSVRRYRFVATDECGNISVNTEANFTIEDNTDPVFDVLPTTYIAECNGSGNVEELNVWLAANGNGLASDICSEVIWEYDLVNETDLCAITGTKLFRFTIIDECGNSVTAEAEFIIQDTQGPIITGGEDMIMEECDGPPAGNYPEFDFWLTNNAGATAVDACGSFVWSNDYHPLNWITICGNTRYVDVIFTATDECGNASSFTSRFSIGDVTPPTFTNCPRLPIIVSAPEGWCSAFVNFSPPAATDNCGGAVITQIDTTGLNSGDLFPVGLTILIFQAEDDCGNRDTCQLKIIVNDFHLPPSMECPDDVVITNDILTCGAAVFGIQPRGIEDNCPDNVSVIYQVENVFGEITGCGILDASGYVFEVGLNTVKYTITDQPILLITEVVNDGVVSGIEITNFGPASYDLSCLEISREGPDSESYMVPADVVLAPGDVYVQLFTTLPEGTQLGYYIGFLDRIIDGVALNGYIPTNFNWSGNLNGSSFHRIRICDTDTAEDWRLANDCDAESLGELNDDLVDVIFPDNGGLATLQSENPSVRMCSFDVEVTDEEAPFCAEVETYDYEGTGGVIESGQCFTSTINVTEDFQISNITISNLVGTYPTMFGLTARLISPNGTQIILFDNICNQTADFDINLDDNADESLENVLCGPAGQGGTYQPIQPFKNFFGESSFGTWTLEIYSSLELSGSLESWEIQFSEMLPYSQTDVTLDAELGICGAEFTWTHAFFGDNCCIGSIRVDYSSVDGINVPGSGVLVDMGGYEVTEFFEVGVTLVTYTLIDQFGNESTCSFEVTVLDNQDPVISPSYCNDVTLYLGPTECSTTYQYPAINASDNCGISEVIFSPAPGYYFPIGTTVVTVTIIDESGNIDSCSYNVTVIEFIPNTTTLVCNDEINLSLGGDCSGPVTGDMLLEGSSYRCYDNYCITLYDEWGVIIGTSQAGTAILTIDHVGTQVTATICSCNDPIVNCCTTLINVAAFSIPLVDCPEDVTIQCNESFDPLFTGTPVVTNCVPTAQISYFDTYQDLGTCSDPRAILNRTWVITNAFGDKVTCNQVITILPFDLEMIDFPNDFVFANAFNCAEVALNPNLTHPDNTGYPTIEGQPVYGSHLCEFNIGYWDEILDDANCTGAYEILRHWTIRNECLPLSFGVNPLRHIQAIKVNDITGPEFSQCFDDITISTDNYSCMGSLNLGNIKQLLSDDCSEVKDVVVIVSGCTVVKSPNGDFIIKNMKKGKHTVKVQVSDNCWNYSVCMFEVTVVDNVPPVMVCIEQTVVSLTTSGQARVFASSFDNGSNDNCGNMKLQVFRMSDNCGIPANTVPGDYVDFCCADVGAGPIMVVLRGWDDADMNGIFGSAGDNYNECMVEIIVDNKIPPIIECPEAITVDCLEDIYDTSVTGVPTVIQGCPNTVLFYTDIENLNHCGTGVVTRIWRVEGFSQVTCTQVININSPKPFDPLTDIIWPSDWEGTCLDNIPMAAPILSTGVCESVAVSKKDDIFNFVDGVCYKILRTWTVIDWCIYSPNDPFELGKYTRTQVIKISDEEAPEIVNCNTVEVGFEGNNCDNGTIILSQSAIDESCGINAELNWTYRFDRENDGTFDVTGTVKGSDVQVAIQNVGLGTHRIQWTVTDGCGNITTCTQLVEVKDVKKPSPICMDEIIAVAMEDGTIQIHAEWFNIQSTDNCTSEEDLRYSFSGNSIVPTRTFTCDDIENGVTQLIILDIWIWDLAGNRDYCTVRLVLQDNSDACEDQAIDRIRISGRVVTENQEALKGVEIILSTGLPDYPLEMVTAQNGMFVFDNNPTPNLYLLSAERNTDYLDGVSTLDLVLIQRYLLGLHDFDSPYKLIAADINNDTRIRPDDLVQLRALILRKILELPSNKSWRFVDAAFEFANPRHPWPFNEKIKVLTDKQDVINNKFIAVKIGDVNESALGRSTQRTKQ